MSTQLESFLKEHGPQALGSLKHWGIKGMKWGIRQSDGESNATSSIQQKLANDPEPKNVDAPVQKDDKPGRSGVTNTDLHYQDYLTKEGHVYTKYSDGTHRLVLNDKKIKHDDGSTDLTHWGIKGMKWGIRRSDAQLARAHGSSASADAVRAKETLTSIRKAGSLSAASDSDLQHLVNRINLEKRYSEINTSAAAKSHEQIKTLLSVGDTANKLIQFTNSPAGKLLKTSLGLSKTPVKGKHHAP